MNRIFLSRKFYLQALALLIVILVSACSSLNRSTDYPEIYSLHHRKPGIRMDIGKKAKHESPVPKEITALNPETIVAEVLPGRTGIMQALLSRPMKPLNNNPGLYNRMTELYKAVPEEGTLTASLSETPYLFNTSIYPDSTQKAGVQQGDSAINKSSRVLNANHQDPGSKKVAHEKHPENWALASIASAILFLPSLLLINSGLYLPFSILAIVCGALGLKSSKRKMALAGLILGIIELVLLIIGLLFLILMLSAISA